MINIIPYFFIIYLIFLEKAFFKKLESTNKLKAPFSIIYIYLNIQI